MFQLFFFYHVLYVYYVFMLAMFLSYVFDSGSLSGAENPSNQSSVGPEGRRSAWCTMQKINRGGGAGLTLTN